MRLFHSATSPFVRKVMVALHETGQLDAVTLIPAAGTPTEPGTMPVDHNPLGKVPALLLDDGRTLFDSRVICRYLDARAGGRLYPAGEALWDGLALEAMADGMMEAAVLMVYESRLRPEAIRFAPWVEGQWAKIARALDMAEAAVPAPDAAFDMPRIALACALGYLDFRHAARDWRASRPRLAAWDAAVASRPSMMATRPPG